MWKMKITALQFQKQNFPEGVETTLNIILPPTLGKLEINWIN